MNSFSKQELIEQLKSHGKIIGQQANKGNKLAYSVIRLYAMWKKCPGDNAAFVGCEDAYKKWFKSNTKNIHDLHQLHGTRVIKFEDDLIGDGKLIVCDNGNFLFMARRDIERVGIMRLRQIVFERMVTK